MVLKRRLLFYPEAEGYVDGPRRTLSCVEVGLNNQIYVAVASGCLGTLPLRSVVNLIPSKNSFLPEFFRSELTP